jgi:hypothetical protein
LTNAIFYELLSPTLLLEYFYSKASFLPFCLWLKRTIKIGFISRAQEGIKNRYSGKRIHFEVQLE